MRLSTIKPINHQAYWQSSLSTIKPIDHWAYQPLVFFWLALFEITQINDKEQNDLNITNFNFNTGKQVASCHVPTSNTCQQRYKSIYKNYTFIPSRFAVIVNCFLFECIYVKMYNLDILQQKWLSKKKQSFIHSTLL